MEAKGHQLEALLKETGVCWSPFRGAWTARYCWLRIVCKPAFRLRVFASSREQDL
jgi:hypothetical protein